VKDCHEHPSSFENVLMKTPHGSFFLSNEIKKNIKRLKGGKSVNFFGKGIDCLSSFLSLSFLLREFEFGLAINLIIDRSIKA
jgi:hypothetical protein